MRFWLVDGDGSSEWLGGLKPRYKVVWFDNRKLRSRVAFRIGFRDQT